VTLSSRLLSNNSVLFESLVTMGDPYNADLTLARDVLDLPCMDNIITDQHLKEPHRVGPGGSFNIGEWQGEGGISYKLNAEDG
jgi:hypothetical protein